MVRISFQCLWCSNSPPPKDETSGEIRCEQVVKPYSNPERAIIEVTMVDEDGLLETIETTFNHPFFVEDRGWTQVDTLQVGDVVTSASGQLQVVRVEWTGQYETVYNFGVEQTRSYFVGETGAWVHNCFDGLRKYLKNGCDSQIDQAAVRTGVTSA